VALTGKQRRFLRALGHSLTAVVMVGREGLTEAVGAAVERALDDHELVKVKLGPNAELDRDQAAERLAAMTGSEVAQVLGKTILLYRARAKDPDIVLPPSATGSDG